MVIGTAAQLEAELLERAMKPTVRMMMNPTTHAVSADVPIRDAIKVLIGEGVTDIPVVSGEGDYLGVLSEYDCLRLIAEGDDNANEAKGTAGAYYSSTVPHVSPEVDIYYVAGMFLREPRHRRFAVLDQGELIGVVTRKDVLRALIDLLPP